MTYLEKTIQEVIGKVKRLLAAHMQLEREPTRARLVDPILDALGWDVDDPRQIRREYRPRPGAPTVDYAIGSSTAPATVGGVAAHTLLEVIPFGPTLDDEEWRRRVLLYAKPPAAAGYCCLTDGNHWRHCRIGARSDFDMLSCGLKPIETTWLYSIDGQPPPRNPPEALGAWLYAGRGPVSMQLERRMMAKRARALTREELDAMCDLDSRVRPIVASEVLRHGDSLNGFAAEYIGGQSDDWHRAMGWVGLAPERAVVQRYWTERCDEAVRCLVERFGVHASGFISDAIQEVLGEEKVAAFRREVESARCFHVWCNILMYYGIARAEILSHPFQHYVRRCLYCGEEFTDGADLRPAYIRYTGRINDFCGPCLALAFQPFRPDVKQGFPSDPDYLSATLRALGHALGVVVPADYVPRAVASLRAQHTRTNAIIAALIPMQPAAVYERVFGSWLGALVASGLLATPAWRTAFGTRCLAEDGHECESLAEKTVDDWLSRRGVAHERAPRYPQAEGVASVMIADWAVGGALVEYWGLQGQEDYDAKIVEKRRLAKSAGIRLIEIPPSDLANPDSVLTEKFADFL